MLSLNWGLLFAAINLLILYALMRKFLFKPVNNIIAKRQEEIEKQLSDADETQKNAQKLYDEYNERLAKSKKDGEAVISDARVKAKAEYDRIVTSAEKNAQNITERAQKDAQAEKERAMQEMQSHITELAAQAAAKIVGVQEAKADDGRLYDEFLNKAGDDSESEN